MRQSITNRQKSLKAFEARQNQIVIKDWAGNILFKGHNNATEVDKVLKANQCGVCKRKDPEDCPECLGTGYEGDFTVEWVDQRDDNVYEHINY